MCFSRKPVFCGCRIAGSLVLRGRGGLACAVAGSAPMTGFPFGFEMTLDAARQPGSKRLPTLEIGDNGEAMLEFWCKSGKGQFSVAGNTVIFVAGPMEDRACPPSGARSMTNWSRR